jgi:methionyl-tRNA formyltransferase
MRVVVLTNAQSNQNALVHKLADYVQVAAVVLSKNIPRKRPSLHSRFRSKVNAVSARLAGGELLAAWREMLERYEAKYPRFDGVPFINVDNINDEATHQILEQHAPDLVVVSGTNLVGRKLIERAKKFGDIVNLHTGISPYVKGGPNCTNWCLAKGWFHLIGNTVMWLDAGVDSGELIASERTPLDGSESLAELHWKVMEHGQDLYVRTVARSANGFGLPRVPQQDVDEGVEFRSAQWTSREMKLALDNYRNRFAEYFRSGRQNSEAKLFPLEP